MQLAAKFSTPIATIARYTIRGYIKERVLIVVLLFSLILILSSYVLAPLAVGAQQKIIIDVGLAAISFIGVLLVVLLGAGSYSGEKEHGILPALLAKPISRVDFILGKYFGTLVTIAFVMATMSAVYLLVMRLSQSPFHGTIAVAVYFSVLEVALIISVMTLFSSFTSPLLSSFFTTCVFISGHLSKDLLAFAQQFGGTFVKQASTVAYYVLPNLSLFNIRPEAVHNLPLSNGLIYSVTIYGLFYTTLALFLSSLIFRTKDVS